MVLFHYHARGNGPLDLPYGRSICSYAHECTGDVLDSIAELSASPEQILKLFRVLNFAASILTYGIDMNNTRDSTNGSLETGN
jgi:hypothetical protein